MPKAKVIVPVPREYLSSHWILEATWKLVNQYAGLMREGKRVQLRACRIGHEIKAALKQDRKAQAGKVADEIVAYLAVGELKEA